MSSMRSIRACGPGGCPDEPGRRRLLRRIVHHERNRTAEFPIRAEGVEHLDVDELRLVLQKLDGGQPPLRVGGLAAQQRRHRDRQRQAAGGDAGRLEAGRLSDQAARQARR